MLAWLAISLIAIQAPAPPTATLTVRVVERTTNAPLAGVTISATRIQPDQGQLTAVSEADGTAIFADLKPGRYEVRTHSETHLAIDELLPDRGGAAILLPSPPDDQDVFVRFPGMASVVVRGNRDLNLRFSLQPGATITGRAVSSASTPAAAEVHLYTIGPNAVLGHHVRSLRRSERAGPDGTFEFRGLQPGRYFVSFRHAHDDTGRMNELFYPGTHDFHEARAVDVSPGIHIDLATIELKPPSTVTVFGRVDDEGTGVGRLIMRRLDLNTGDVIVNVPIHLHGNGTFSAPGIDPGVQGLLYTRVGQDGSLLAAATAVVHVGAESPQPVDLRPVLPASMSGRFVFDGPYEPIRHDLDPQLYLSPEGPDAWLRASLNEGGVPAAGEAFRVNGIVGAHRIVARAPLGWIVEGVILEDGRNILDSILEFEPGRHYANVRVLLSRRAATIEGRVEHSAASSWRVIVFAVEETLWGSSRYQRQSEIKRDGSFRVDGLAPGREYYVATCEWPCLSDPEDLESRVKAATRVYVDRPAVFKVNIGGRD